jgi:hypothetical protein
VIYRASNGITSALLTEDEAREDYEQAEHVRGEFGGTFVTCPVGEYGRVLTCAATTYTPILDEACAGALGEPEVRECGHQRSGLFLALPRR